MGGSFQTPNLGPLISVITRMMQSPHFTNNPLNSDAKVLMMRPELLKIMLGQTGASKHFGVCLASVCKEDENFSKKVAKVFLKSINNANLESVKNYMKALKPFLLIDDSLKTKKLEWVLGIYEITSRKDYKQTKFKYGVELVDTIGEECSNYQSPIVRSHMDDALLMQLFKCKGKLDAFAVNCLKELLSLMAKDEVIARFIYTSGPPTY